MALKCNIKNENCAPPQVRPPDQTQTVVCNYVSKYLVNGRLTPTFNKVGGYVLDLVPLMRPLVVLFRQIEIVLKDSTAFGYVTKSV